MSAEEPLLSVPVDQFYCPITNKLMEDPVTTKYGHSFERAAIVDWIDSHSSQCPLTKQPLTVNDLFPNRSLKALIDTHKHKLQPTRPPKSAIEEADAKQDDSLVIAKCHTQNGTDLHVLEVTASQTAELLPMAIVLTIDISGSMDEEVVVKGEDGQDVANGFTKLDLVKHAALTIIQNLQDQDRLGLVVYDDAAQLVLKCIPMTAKGKKEASALVHNLETRRSTNLWDGIRVSLIEIERVTRDHPENVNRHVMLLTDGEPNISPSGGEIAALKEYLNEHPLDCALHAFGFGYDLKSDMLQKIAVAGQGSYAFIPDGGFVGTAFINAMAYAMTVVARDVSVTVPEVSAEHCVFPYSSSVIQVGCLGVGQSKFIVFKGDPQRVQVTYKSASGNSEVEKVLVINDQPQVLQKNLELLQAKKLLLDSCDDSETSSKGAQKVEQAIAVLKGEADQEIEDFLIDLKGQVTLAFSREDWLKRWGLHYVRSLSLAHANRVCVNFKDPGVQHYGGAKFNELRDKFEKVFLTIKAPRPSGLINGGGDAPENMGGYYNARAVCFTGSTQVQLAGSDQWKEIRKLKKGDLVASAHGNSAAVVCLVETQLDRACEIVRIGDIGVTAWHPIRTQGEGAEWGFPAELYPECKSLEVVESVYNVVLVSGHEIVLRKDKSESVNGITLGHGVTSNAVLSHPYFGTDSVVRDLMKYPSWETGLVQIKSTHIHKDPMTALINKIAFV